MCWLFFILFSKKVLTDDADSCIIIQVADRYGCEAVQQALIGKRRIVSERLEKNFKKVLDKLS